MALDESMRFDTIFIVNGINVSVERSIISFVEDCVIDLVEILDDRRLIIINPDLMC